jgi:hypothetical protein
MKIFISFFIFCIVLFIYLHVQFQLKNSNDLEIYEIDDVSKEKLEEICDMRQPVLFDVPNEKLVQLTNKKFICDNYQAFEIKIRNSNDNKDSELYVPLPLHASIKLFDEDKESSYFSENNMDFIEETGIIKTFKYNDEFLRPGMVSNCNYDILMGSTNTCTPFRYKLNYRNFFMLTHGSAKLKIAPPQSKRYLYPNYDYENFEFSSPINPWNVQPKYISDFDKIKCLEFTLLPGKTLFLPARWWYSIQFLENTSISCFYYKTYMNNVAIIPSLFMHGLQIQNVKRNVVKKASNTNENDLIKLSNLKQPVIIPTNISEKSKIERNVENEKTVNDPTNIIEIGESNIDDLPQTTL